MARLRLKEVTTAQWHAFFGAFLGWLLDGFDFSILTFLLVDIEHSFTVDKALAGALGTVTLMFRLAGGIGAGTAADRFGRKGPLMLCILWISLFSLLSGFSVNYFMLFGCRALFGIGMGGVWASALPLALEHWPDRLRGAASGLLMGGFNWGYILAAVVFHLLYPVFTRTTVPGWRVLFWVAALPAFLVFWIRANVEESPVWLSRNMSLRSLKQSDTLSIVEIFRRNLIGTTLQTSSLMAAFMFSNYSVTFWYPTFLRQSHLKPLQFIVALNVGAIIGTALWGQVSETTLGRRGAVTLAALMGVLVIPIFVGSNGSLALLFGALMMGIGATGAWGIMPSYLTERFPTATRAIGPGFSYHAGAFIASLTPTIIGVLQDRGVSLVSSMSACMLASALLVVTIMWLGPETRGRSFANSD
jgi:SHS family lactate transporter-like MFS transporter